MFASLLPGGARQVVCLYLLYLISRQVVKTPAKSFSFFLPPPAVYIYLYERKAASRPCGVAA
jgi:hypothetical protein